MLGCEYCQLTYGHDYRCRNYIPPKASHYCSICGEGILNGEEYIENDCGDFAHWECVDYGRDLAEWLGYEIKEMEEINDEYNI